MEKQTEIQLVNFQGSIKTKVFAGINEKGDLYLYGYDTGNLPPSDMYDDDVEYRLDIPASGLSKVHKLIIQLMHQEERAIPDELLPGHQKYSNLPDLLHQYYLGDVDTFDKFKRLLEKNAIDHTFNWG